MARTKKSVMASITTWVKSGETVPKATSVVFHAISNGLSKAEADEFVSKLVGEGRVLENRTAILRKRRKNFGKVEIDKSAQAEIEEIFLASIHFRA